MKHANREAWLEAAAEALKPLFADAGEQLPPVHVSVGFPSTRALSAKRQRIGECWHPRISADGLSHIFISPVLSDGVVALSTLVHELIHALRPGDGHKKPFVEVMKKVGLEGKPTATVAGESLTQRLNALLEDLGPYPQPKFNAAALQEEKDKKKQTTRLLKATCAEGPDDDKEKAYVVRVTKVHLDEHGAPFCPCHLKRMTVDGWEPDDMEEGE